MQTFKDNKERSWEVVLNVAALKRVKGLIGVDLLEVVEGKLLERLASDAVLLCDVVYAVCKPQADKANVSDEDFGQAIAGDVIDAATEALLEELVDFFPRARREVLRKILTKLKSLESMTLQAATDGLDSKELEELMQAELEGLDLKRAIRERLAELRSAGSSSTSSPEQPASPPGR